MTSILSADWRRSEMIAIGQKYLQMHFLVWILLIQISLKFILSFPINNKLASVGIMA